VSWHDSFSRDSEAIAQWHAMQGDPEWAVRRSRFQSLLSEAGRLRGIADLVGVTALPTEERLTLLSAGLASEAILQQSALSERDAFCSLAKQAALVQAVLDVHAAARTLGHADVPASVIETFDFGPLLRAKDTVGSEDAEGVNQILSGVLTAMKELAT
jgi:V/A-type H+-transporting ATPase subunit A